MTMLLLRPGVRVDAGEEEEDEDEEARERRRDD